MGRVFASADWHGNDLGFKVLDFLKPDDTLYFLGDAIDRGLHGFELLEKLLADPRVKMINGNHERMMCDALKKFLVYHEGKYMNMSDFLWATHWFNNGGYETWINGLCDKTRDEICDIINKLDKQYCCMIYASPAGHEVILEHAGHTPTDMPHRSHDPYWDREHFYDKWDEHNFKNTYLIHGHTPVQYLRFEYGYDGQPKATKEDLRCKGLWREGLYKYAWYKPEVIRYCDGHKFDIDLCTIVSDRIALLDLDTFEEIYFDTGDCD